MKKIIHESHTVFSLREWSKKHPGIHIVQRTGNRLTARERWHPYNWRFLVTAGKPRWHWMIRLPFFQFTRDNSGFEIGTQNLFLWIVN